MGTRCPRLVASFSRALFLVLAIAQSATPAEPVTRPARGHITHRLVVRGGRSYTGQLLTRSGSSVVFRDAATGEIVTLKPADVWLLSDTQGRELLPGSAASPPAPQDDSPETSAAKPTAPAPTGTNPLSSPEALASALGLARTTARPPLAPRHPMDDIERWMRLTALQREQELDIYETVLKVYRRRRKESQGAGGLLSAGKSFKGKNVSWRLRVSDVGRGPDGQCLRLTARSHDRHIVSADFPRASKASLLRMKKGQHITLRGSVNTCAFRQPQLHDLLAGITSEVLEVVLSDCQFAIDANALRSVRTSAKPLRTVVYLCDSSGSMAPLFDEMRIALISSISELPPTTCFHIIFWSSSLQEGPQRRPVRADGVNRQRMFEFLKRRTPSGNTNVIPALQRGFAAFQQVAGTEKVICLLSDGDFAGITGGAMYRSPAGGALRGNAAVVQWLRDQNTEKAIKINTVLLGNNATGIPVMKTIASDNGGRFHQIKRPPPVQNGT